jgi:hypothetical protein
MFVQNTTGLDAFVPATYSEASGTTLTALLQGVNLVNLSANGASNITALPNASSWTLLTLDRHLSGAVTIIKKYLVA